MHGAMNDEDKGLLHRYILGRLVMNFRQWMVGVYSKRYRGKYWDADLKQWREGSYATAYYVLRNYFRVLTNQKSKIEKELLLKNLSKERKANLRRMLADYIVYLTVKLLVIPALGDPDESEGDWWVRYAIYQALRVDLEMGGTVAGIEIVNNAQKIINSPIAAATTMEKWLLLFDVPSMFETTGTSILNQENKWVHNVENKVVPFVKHIK
jgi:hypothetical protein